MDCMCGHTEGQHQPNKKFQVISTYPCSLCKCKRLWQFASLLGAGASIQQAASKMAIPERTAYRWAKRAVEDGLLEQTCAWPKIYRKKVNLPPGLNLVGDLPPAPLTLPHKYGGSFRVIGRLPPLKMDETGRHFIVKGSHTLQIGRSKAVIWVKHFRGLDARTCLAYAFEDLLRLAAHYSALYAIQLTLDRVFDGVEWVVIDDALSSKLASKLEIPPTREIAMAAWKKDSSHPHHIEINQAPGQPAHLPTQHAHTLEYLLLEAPTLLERMIKASEALDKRLTTLERK